MLHTIKQFVPVSAKNAIKVLLQKYYRPLKKYLETRRLERAFQSSLPIEEQIPLPPVSLRFRVAGHHDIKAFHYSGQKFLQCFESALMSTGHELGTFRSVLDFGTGCGRLMRWMKPLQPHAKLYGCDIDEETIRWSRKYLKFAAFEVNQGLPPLPYTDQLFDLVIGLSVFTHLNEEYQNRWLAELNRVTRPGAMLLLTIHGDSAWAGFTENYEAVADVTELNRAYQRDGFFFHTNDGWDDIFPDFYHSMFHKQSYVLSHWADYFDIVGYVEKGMLSKQDIVIARKRPMVQ